VSVETPLPKRVRIQRPGQPVRLLRTMGEAIDFVQEEIPDPHSERWQPVQERLVEADQTRTPADLAEARSILVSALRAEGWLYGDDG
jgi:hypothetical protein